MTISPNIETLYQLILLVTVAHILTFKQTHKEHTTRELISRSYFGTFMVCFLLFFAISAQPTPALEQTRSVPPTQNDALFFYSFQYGMSYYEKFNSDFLYLLKSKDVSYINIYFGYMDLVRNDNTQYRNQIADPYRYKYHDHNVSALIIEEEHALKFFSEEGKDLFPDVPILNIYGPKIETIERQKGDRKIALMTFDQGILRTLKYALNLLPETRKVIYVGGSTEAEKRHEKVAKENIFVQREDKLEFEYTSNLTYDEMIQSVTNLSSDTIIIFTYFFADRYGTALIPRDVLKKITIITDVPTFGIYETAFDTGIVGDSIARFENDGVQSANLTLDILNEKITPREPVATIATTKTPMFDYQELKRWELDKNKIPGKSVLSNYESSFWEKYKNYVIVGIIICILQASIIVVLMFQMKKWKLAEHELHEKVAQLQNEVITQQKIESELRESKEKFRALVENIQDTVARFNNQYRYIYINNTTKKFIGKDPEYFIGKSYRELGFKEKDVKFLEDSMHKVFNEGKPHQSGFELCTQCGTRYFDLCIFPEFDENKKVNTVVTLSRDITERINTERKLKRAYENLERLNKELEQFTYISYHDLQEPLRTMCGFAGLLESNYKGKLSSEADEFIDYIISGSKRMQQMLSDILTFSGIGTRGKEFKPTNIEKILDIVSENLHATIEENQAIITRDPMPTITADETQMIQLFQNLIENAIKFRREETPKIHISVKNTNSNMNSDMNSDINKEEWLFSVKDNGIGIDNKQFKKLFVIFQRLHNKEEYPGTGVGIAVCRKIVERHGGKIWVESDLGVGSVFYFTVPTISIENFSKNCDNDNNEILKGYKHGKF